MTHPSKQKGNRFERLIVDKAHSYGVKGERAWGSNGRSLGMHEEVDVLLEGDLRIQAKCRKKIADGKKTEKTEKNGKKTHAVLVTTECEDVES